MAHEQSVPRKLIKDERRCLERLKVWQEEILELLSFIGSASRDAADSERWTKKARERLNRLKKELRDEAQRLDAQELTPYYARAIRQVSGYLTVQGQSNKADEWRHQLGSALVTIAIAVSRLTAKRTGSDG